MNFQKRINLVLVLCLLSGISSSVEREVVEAQYCKNSSRNVFSAFDLRGIILPENEKASLLQAGDEVQLFLNLLLEEDVAKFQKKIDYLRNNWKEPYLPCLLEILRFRLDHKGQQMIIELLEYITGQDGLDTYYDWVEWIWQQELKPNTLYVELKAELYALLDPKFEEYFSSRAEQMRIRLDEVMWGGVLQDGIPPLRYPSFVDSDDAKYLDDSNVVFGVVINGQAKAYPKRILAWHEMAVDRFEDTEIALVYCTLCGTVIAYDMQHNGVKHVLGTSGFLYRSNKLMYDKATQSLWNTIEGKPVIGPLVDRGIELESYPVTTTTWAAWNESYPETKVLSVETGYRRDYDEGAAYYKYFSTDELMFPVPMLSPVLKNKQEVMVVRIEGYAKDPVAFSVDYLKEKRWHQEEINGRSVILAVDGLGILRAFDAADVLFTDVKDQALVDIKSREWEIGKTGLSNGKRLLRELPSHNIFWFAWYNSYPHTRLIK